MNIYFVDYENVRQKGLEGLESLSMTDKVILFHYQGEGEIKFETLERLAKSRAFTKVQRITKHEKNAMDFEIVALLGYMLKENGPAVKYRIVSNDKGYLAAIELLKGIEPKANIELVSSLTKGKTMLEEKVDAVLSTKRKVSKKTAKIMSISTSLSELHNNLVKEFKADGTQIYKLVSPVYKELCI